MLLYSGDAMTSIQLWQFNSQFPDPSEKSGFMNAKFFGRSQPVEALALQGLEAASVKSRARAGHLAISAASVLSPPAASMRSKCWSNRPSLAAMK